MIVLQKEFAQHEVVVVVHAPPGSIQAYDIMGFWCGRDRTGMHIVQLSGKRELLRVPELEIMNMDQFFKKQEAA